LLRTTSSRELAEMKEFEKLEPFGDPWRQTASIEATIRNTQRASETDKVWTADELMPLDPDVLADSQCDAEPAPDAQSDEEVKRILGRIGWLGE
jgi:hypothetical protein